jgi:glycosyltransferase involved in cell wall biosynthesis
MESNRNNMNTNTPFFSIVIPAYNRAHILAETLQSVLVQTFTNWEVIVVDDGSKDNTKEVMQALVSEKIKYVYQNNAERSAARNNGIKNALGKYICFLDSDDSYCENHLETLHKFITENNFPVAQIFVNCNYVKENSSTQPSFPSLTKSDVLSYFLKNSVVPIRLCIHKDIFFTFNFREDIVIVEDTVLWGTISTQFESLHLEKYTVNYHIHQDQSVDISNNCFLPRLKGLEKMFEQENIQKVLKPSIKKEILSDCYYGIARHYEMKRNFSLLLSNIIKSLLLEPTGPRVNKKLYMIYAYFFKKNYIS